MDRGQLTGGRRSTGQTANVTAEVLNSHYATISTNNCYTPSRHKQTASHYDANFANYINDWRVFQILDKLYVLPPPASMNYQRGSLDWALLSSVNQLHVGLTYLSLPPLFLFSGSEPPYVIFKKLIGPTPKQPADFSPISVTPVLACTYYGTNRRNSTPGSST